MKEKLPINADVLIWARTSLGISVGDVARRMNKSQDEIEAWEKGDSSPSYPQLERLAYEIYKRPVAVFFFPEVPKEDTPKTEFRTLPDTILDALPREIVKLYRKAKLFQLNLEELFEGEDPSKQPLLQSHTLERRTEMTSFAAGVRKSLEIDIDEQTSWRSTDTAFKKWRAALEIRGVFVFKDAFENDQYSGFCLFHEKYPLIFVNNSMPDTRQIFTLFHELAHLLLHAGGIDFRSSEILDSLSEPHRSTEILCNHFANIFLVPPDAFQAFSLKVSEAEFERLAEHFCVSREVILRNFLDRRLVDESDYQKFVNKWSSQLPKKKDDGGGNYYYNQKAYLGENYIQLAYGKYYQNKFTVDVLADYLNVKLKNLPAFEHFVMEGGRAK